MKRVISVSAAFLLPSTLVEASGSIASGYIASGFASSQLVRSGKFHLGKLESERLFPFDKSPSFLSIAVENSDRRAQETSLCETELNTVIGCISGGSTASACATCLDDAEAAIIAVEGLTCAAYENAMCTAVYDDCVGLCGATCTDEAEAYFECKAINSGCTSFDCPDPSAPTPAPAACSAELQAANLCIPNDACATCLTDTFSTIFETETVLCVDFEVEMCSAIYGGCSTCPSTCEAPIETYFDCVAGEVGCTVFDCATATPRPTSLSSRAPVVTTTRAPGPAPTAAPVVSTTVPNAVTTWAPVAATSQAPVTTAPTEPGPCEEVLDAVVQCFQTGGASDVNAGATCLDETYRAVLEPEDVTCGDFRDGICPAAQDGACSACGTTCNQSIEDFYQCIAVDVFGCAVFESDFCPNAAPTSAPFAPTSAPFAPPSGSTVENSSSPTVALTAAPSASPVVPPVANGDRGANFAQNSDEDDGPSAVVAGVVGATGALLVMAVVAAGLWWFRFRGGAGGSIKNDSTHDHGDFSTDHGDSSPNRPDFSADGSPDQEIVVPAVVPSTVPPASPARDEPRDETYFVDM